MSSATLSAQLQAISGGTEGAAIAAWTAAWAAYFAGAVAGSGPGVAFTTDPTAITNARNAMAAHMTGLASDGLADDRVQAGIVGWWDHLVANPGTYFAGATSISKPSELTDIAAALPAIFASNTSGSLSASAACDAIASAIHSRNDGGSAFISSMSQGIA